MNVFVMYMIKYRTAGIFPGGEIFVNFMVERRTTKYLPMKQYCIVPGCGLGYRNQENISTNWPKIQCSRKFYPPKNTRYTVTNDEALAVCYQYQEQI